MITINDFERVTTCKRHYKIDTGCDYMIITYDDVLKNDIPHGVINSVSLDDSGALEIEADLIIFDEENNVDINAVTGETINHIPYCLREA